MGLKDLSKKPEKSPRMMKMYWQFKIKALAEKATADNKRINGAVELNASIASLTPSGRLSNIENNTTNSRAKNSSRKKAGYEGG